MKSVLIAFICLFCSLSSFGQIVFTREHRLNERVTVFSEDNGKTWGAKVDNEIVIKPEYIAVSLLGNRYLCLTKYDAKSETLLYGMANLAGIIQLDCEYEQMSMRKGQLVAFRAPEVFGDEEPDDDSNFEYLAADEELLHVTVVDNIIGGVKPHTIDLDRLTNAKAKNNLLVEVTKEKKEAQTKENAVLSKDDKTSDKNEPLTMPLVEKNEETAEEADTEKLEKIVVSVDLKEAPPEVAKSDSVTIKLEEEAVAENSESIKALSADTPEASVTPEQLEKSEQKEAPVAETVEATKEAEADVVQPFVAVSRINEDSLFASIDKLLTTIDLNRDIDMEKDYLLADIKQKQEQEEAELRVEMMPFFPGGEEEMQQFIRDNLEYPEEAQVQGIQGKVILRFLVVENGNTQNVEVMESLDEGCDEEAIRIVKLMPRWQPALRDGVPVPIHFTLPISFYF